MTTERNEATIPVGIDLGTTFSAIAFLDRTGRPCTIANSEGELTTPSVVYFDQDVVIVGSEAEFAGETDSSRLARAAKRDMGGVRFRRTILDRHLPPEVIQAFVLQRLKNDAALKLGEFSQAVVTVPAYFNEPRRKATQDAGALAGLDVIDIINEPTAAALAYGAQRGFLNPKGESLARELILVYDLGGGTFDATLMEIDGPKFTAIGTAGDVYLGGVDWDQRLFDYVKQEIESRHQIDVDADPNLHEKLMNQCVRAKKSLTARPETVIRQEHNGQRFTIMINRQTFSELTRDLLERTRLTTERLLKDANLNWSDLTKLLPVGGSTRMPMVLEMLEQQSGLPIDRSLSPDEAVAHGAAIYAGILLRHGSAACRNISITNINSHDLGVLGIDPKTREPRRKIVIPRNHRLPVISAKRFQTSKDGQRKIVVQIVEGGTDEGQGATTIGSCIVTDLPPNINRGTEVVVSFNYLTSGRLEVVAQIPSLDLSANSAIDRAVGMTAQQLQCWQKKLARGADFLIDEPIVKSSRLEEPAPRRHAPEKKPPRPHRNYNPAIPSRSKLKIKSDGREASGLEKKLAGKFEIVAGSNSDSEMDEISGFFVVGDEVPKPEIGVSALGIFRQNSDASARSAIGDSALDFLQESDDQRKKHEPGESALDFLNENEPSNTDADDSALDEFLSELED